MPSMHPSITTTTEGGGHVLACTDCHWTRFYPGSANLPAASAEHARKCKGPKAEKATPSPTAPRAASWDDREGATWIDSL